VTTPADKPILRAIIYLGVATLLFLLLWFALDALLTIFAGILFGIFLRGLADLLSGHTRLSVGWALFLIIIAGVFATVGFSWSVWPRVAAQFDQLLAILPGTIHTWVQNLRQYEWGRWVVSQSGDVVRAVMSRLNVTKLFSGVLDATIFVVVVVFIGIYVAVRPFRYREGAVHLIPREYRGRVRDILAELAYTLRWWMIGRSIAMAAVGALDLAGMLILGVPLALTLALISGLFTFVPYIGATIAMIPAVLVALSVSTQLALYVFLLKLAVQTLEGYVITPLVQRRVVHLPPALTISTQFLLGETVGVLGLMFATPLTAMALVLVKMLYFHERPER
jgi:predicted PurR-regulated permease PerM